MLAADQEPGGGAAHEGQPDRGGEQAEHAGGDAEQQRPHHGGAHTVAVGDIARDHLADRAGGHKDAGEQPEESGGPAAALEELRQIGLVDRLDRRAHGHQSDKGGHQSHRRPGPLARRDAGVALAPQANQAPLVATGQKEQRGRNEREEREGQQAPRAEAADQGPGQERPDGQPDLPAKEEDRGRAGGPLGHRPGRRRRADRVEEATAQGGQQEDRHQPGPARGEGHQAIEERHPGHTTRSQQHRPAVGLVGEPAEERLRERADQQVDRQGRADLGIAEAQGLFEHREQHRPRTVEHIDGKMAARRRDKDPIAPHGVCSTCSGRPICLPACSGRPICLPHGALR